MELGDVFRDQATREVLTLEVNLLQSTQGKRFRV